MFLCDFMSCELSKAVFCISEHLQKGKNSNKTKRLVISCGSQWQYGLFLRQVVKQKLQSIFPFKVISLCFCCSTFYIHIFRRICCLSLPYEVISHFTMVPSSFVIFLFFYEMKRPFYLLTDKGLWKLATERYMKNDGNKQWRTALISSPSCWNGWVHNLFSITIFLFVFLYNKICISTVDLHTTMNKREINLTRVCDDTL